MYFYVCSTEITTYVVDDLAGYGRRFDGIGAISGGGVCVAFNCVL
jgi:hypothetical protein